MNLPLGSWRFGTLGTETEYLDSTTSNLTYHFKGQGKGTIIKPYGFTVADIQRSDYNDGAPAGFLFKLNENSAGTKATSFPRHPRAIFEDMRVDGVDSPYGGFVWFNEASFQFRNVDFDRMCIGATGVGYVDQVKILGTCTWRTHRTMVVTGTDSNKYVCVIDHISTTDDKPVTGANYLRYWALTTLAATHTWADDTEYIAGWGLKMTGNGDGLVIDTFQAGAGGVTTPESQNVVYLKNCAGGRISAPVAGRYVFVDCAGITTDDAHLENAADTSAAQGSIRIHSSNILLKNNYLWNLSSYSGYPVIIDDNIGLGASYITLEDNTFIRRSNSLAKQATYDIFIKRLNRRSKLVLKNNKGNYERAGRIGIYSGIRIGADDVATSLIPNTLFSDNKHLLSGDVEISSVNDVHTIKKFGDALGVWNFPALDTPSAGTLTANANNTYDTLLSNTAYYYKCAIYNSIGNTAGSATATITTPVSPADFEANDNHGFNLSALTTAGVSASLAPTAVSPLAGTYSLKATITNGGTQESHVKVYRQGITLDTTIPAKVVFKAKADSARTVRVKMKNLDTNASQGVDELINLTSSSQDFTINFTPTTTYAFNELSFWCGNSNVSVVLDNVDVQKQSDSSSLMRWAIDFYTPKGVNNSFIRLWRGDSDFTADRYVDVPLVLGQISRLYDSGETVNCYPWVTTSIPAVPTVNTAYRGSWDGTNKIVWASATPTDGTWATGDKLFYPAPAAGGFEGQICVTAGSPGTWKTKGAISA
ncbi:MAG: hypothetical protein NUW09_03300 [Deltaproteobacteria bacterium]|nr:hypothetical protein [Deltaproteobacteria bacterium]